MVLGISSRVVGGCWLRPLLHSSFLEFHRLSTAKVLVPKDLGEPLQAAHVGGQADVDFGGLEVGILMASFLREA